jgi:hypothetical protein
LYHHSHYTGTPQTSMKTRIIADHSIYHSFPAS